MPLSDVGEVAHAVGSITDLVGNILDRADRDGPTKTLNEDITKIQNSFIDANLDEQWAIAYRLLANTGHPITPGGYVGDIERQCRHQFLIATAELKYLRAIVARIVAERAKE